MTKSFRWFARAPIIARPSHEPLIDSVISFGAAHFYISQSDKSGLVLGGDLDGFNSYAQRSGLPIVEGDPHPDNAEFTLERFEHGYQIDERALARNRTPIEVPPWPSV